MISCRSPCPQHIVRESLGCKSMVSASGSASRRLAPEGLEEIFPKLGIRGAKTPRMFLFDGAFAPRRSGLVLSSMRSRGALVPYRRIRVPHMEGFANRPSVVTLATMATY